MTVTGRKVIPRVGVAAALALLALLPLVPGFSVGAEGAPLLLPSADQGSWVAADKELHFAASLAIAASLRVEGRPRETALAMTFSVGLLKEAYDATIRPRRLRRGASWKDLVVDLAGAAAGIAVLDAIDR
ncbi:MAG TPA: hypothetical protein VGK76_03070 [Candidatus Eisenbacteria bacterium]|jgi:uncharacterized protein YfiM (DUF2279 family)